MKHGGPLTWGELAEAYDEMYPNTSRKARTLPSQTLFEWAEDHPEKFDFKNGSIYWKEVDPIKRETNEQFLKRLLTQGCPTGIHVQPFVIEALAFYSKQVLAMPDDTKLTLIDIQAWKKTAQHVLDEVQRKYGKKLRPNWNLCQNRDEEGL